ncbi:MAG: cell division protein FtsA [Thomasclavelia sp.]|jgi:cell division protein FtsA|nr:cell division protein FtsA [Thomasclavelia sp.]
MKDVYAVLDIGSATVKILVAEVINSNLNVLYQKKIPSHGIKNGIIEDSRFLIKDVREIVSSAEEFLDAKIKCVGVNIPTTHAKLYQSDSSISLGDGGVVTSEDVVRVLKLSSHFKRNKDEEVISVIPVKFHSDKGATTEAPLNQPTRNLIVDSLVITSNKKVLYPYIEIVEKAGLEVADISINAFSCAKEAFDEAYLQEGAILIDMGYKTSTISFYKDGYLKYLTTCQVGGYNFTRSIAAEMQIPMKQAETYKIKYGSLDYTVGQEDVIHTTYYNDEDSKEFTQKELCDILNKSAHEVMEVIKDKIKVIDDGHNYETIIVGGGAELEMLDEVASEVLDSPSRLYRPDIVGIRDMSFVSTVGMVFYMADRAKILGPYETAVQMPDVTGTMSIRFKGLTKTQPKEHTSKFNKLLDSFFKEED